MTAYVKDFLQSKGFKLAETEIKVFIAQAVRELRAITDWLPNVKFATDGFHLEKRLKQIDDFLGRKLDWNQFKS